MAYRPISIQNKAYGFEQTLNRTALSVDCFKYLLNFHGFVPYLGLGLNLDSLSLTEVDKGSETRSKSTSNTNVSYVFGWDIRPVDYPFFALRTNMRYTPNHFLQLDDNSRVSYDHFEFNFIQLVFYIDRTLSFLDTL